MDATTNRSLEPIAPEKALDLYLRARRTEVAESTIKAHKYRLGHFLDWCDQVGIENLNGLTGRKLHEYKLWRRDDGDLNKVSLKGQMDTLRVFIRWCESIDAVETDLSTKVLSPDLSSGENQRDVMLETDTAETILDHLARFEYASFDHLLLLLLWRTGMRTGAAHGLDIEDYDSDEGYISVRHRAGTPLKNKEDGERMIAVSPATCDVVDDWLRHQRPDVTDDAGREPLLATTHGRPHKSTLRDTVYRWTRPCQYLGECPHGRDMDSCEATDDHAKTASKCPSSVSPHAIRRGSITHHLSEDVPEKVVSDRMNVGMDVLDKHYDRRSEEVKMEQRRGYLQDI